MQTSKVKALWLLALGVGCSSPPPPPPEVGAAAQAVEDISLFRVGTAWDRQDAQVVPNCVPGTVSFQRLNRVHARVFRLSSRAEISRKLAAATPAAPDAAITFIAALRLALQFTESSTDEVYVIATTFLEQEGRVLPPLVPSSSCASLATGKVNDFIRKCGTDAITRVVSGGYGFLWVDATTLGAALPAVRAQLANRDEAAEVDAEALLRELGPTGVRLTVDTEFIPGDANGEVFSTTEILRLFEAAKAQANAQPLGAPNLRRLSTELSPVPLDAIEACVGPTALTASQWACLHTQVVRLTDFANETGSGLARLRKYDEARVILERMRLEPEPFIFSASPPALCDSVRLPGQLAPPLETPAGCARNVYSYIASNYLRCRRESEERLPQCVAAVQTSGTCDSLSGAVAPECSPSSRCQTLLDAVDQAPVPQPRGNRPTVLPGSAVRPNRTYSLGSGSQASRVALQEEPTKDSLCFLMGFGGLFDDDGNYVHLVEGPDFWEVELRNATGRVDLTRYGDATVECVDKARFNRPFWTQGTLTSDCAGPGTCPLIAPATRTQSFSALAGIGGRWQHWNDAALIHTVVAPFRSQAELQAVSGGSKQIRINWFAADPALVHPSLSSNPPPHFSLSRGSRPAQTVSDWSSAARPVVMLPVTTETGICYLSSVRGEFVRSEDSVLVSTDAKGQYVLSVSSGWNTVDRRDVAAGAQCVLYR